MPRPRKSPDVFHVALLAALAVALPCAAQDVADPGRRLTPEEIRKLDSQTGGPAEKPPVPQKKSSNSPKNPAACDQARTNYMMMCGAPNSNKSYSRGCAEARDIQIRACES
jgi:hypothetical protein